MLVQCCLYRNVSYKGLTAEIIRRAQGTLSAFNLWSKALLPRDRCGLDVDGRWLKQIGLSHIGSNRSIAYMITWENGGLDEVGLV